MTWGPIAARLFLAACALTGLGALAGRVFPGFCHDRGEHGRTVRRLLFGQVLLVLWLYARSAVNGLVGVIVPIGRADAVVLACSLAAIAVCRRSPPRADRGAAWWSGALAAGPALLVIAVAIAVSSWLELPRLIMLSSDPDQHAFMARQIARLGTLPYWTQGAWGSRDLDYPGGFAVLNFAWASLSGVDVRNVVQVQGVLQTQLALLLLLDRLVRAPATLGEAVRATGAGLVMVGLFYRVLPYGYQPSIYHLEATGRVACVLFVAAAVAFASDAIRARLEPSGEGAALLGRAALGGAAILAVAGLVNIVVLPYLALVFALGAGVYGRGVGVRTRAAAMAALALGPAALLLDPYYLKRFFRPELVHYVAAPPPVAQPAPVGAALATSARGVLLHPFSTVLDALSTAVLSPRASAVLLAGAMLAVLVLVAAGGARKADVFAPLAVTATLVAARIVVLPLSSMLAARSRDGYLLAAYLEWARAQIAYAVLAMVLATVVAVAARARMLPSALGLLALAALLLVGPRPDVGAFRRQPYVGAMGGVTMDDLRVIDATERLYATWRRTHPGAVTYASVPKILAPNRLLHQNGESWLFPEGAARVVPLYEVFPVAFFYFQGSAEYTYEAYDEHVCRRLDLRWLAARRIRYLYLPSDRDDVCVAGGPAVPSGLTVVARSGASVLVELSADDERRANAAD